MDTRETIRHLRHNEELTIKEIAKKLGMWETTVFRVLGKTGRLKRNISTKPTINKDEKKRLRFWGRVIKGGLYECWEWGGYKTPLGYGRLHHFGKYDYAHRVAYIYSYGPIKDDLHVLHHCDNPACVNPTHLFLGTHQDNMIDRDKKQRGRYKSAKWVELAHN